MGTQVKPFAIESDTPTPPFYFIVRGLCVGLIPLLISILWLLIPTMGPQNGLYVFCLVKVPLLGVYIWFIIIPPISRYIIGLVIRAREWDLTLLTGLAIGALYSSVVYLNLKASNVTLTFAFFGSIAFSIGMVSANFTTLCLSQNHSWTLIALN